MKTFDINQVFKMQFGNTIIIGKLQGDVDLFKKFEWELWINENKFASLITIGGFVA